MPARPTSTPEALLDKLGTRLVAPAVQNLEVRGVRLEGQREEMGRQLRVLRVDG